MAATAIDKARQQAARGAAGAAVSTLQAAAAQGDAAAVVELATWHLAGANVPRDLAAARALLRRAAALGHQDAALIEIALTANGSGAAPDFAHARALLARAATTNAVAARQLAAIAVRPLAADGSPIDLPAPERLCASPHVVRFRGLLSQPECAEIAGAVNDILEPAVVVDPATGRQVAHPVRTSDGAVIGPTRENLVVRMVNLRIAAASATPVDAGEALAVLRYAPGQQYRAHHDALPHSRNQRVATALVYLNDGYGGGETQFLATGLAVRGQTGDVVIFRNVDAAGQPDPRALHAGLPVTSGVKWLATRWIRQRPIDVWNMAAAD